VSNRAGDTHFVAPELVSGTLKAGFDFYRSLEAPFQRAVFVMFLVAEVHPFLDGNGRTARIMMNAELAAAGEQRIIIPTVFRNNYLAALRALTRSVEPEPLVRTLDFAQRYTAKVDWSARHISLRILEATHAFTDAATAEERGVRLTIPDDILVAEILAGCDREGQ
jgi:Fic family protein